LSFVAAKIQQNCTGNYNSKATRQGIICDIKAGYRGKKEYLVGICAK
jgi:hypothetical protein